MHQHQGDGVNCEVMLNKSFKLLLKVIKFWFAYTSSIASNKQCKSLRSMPCQSHVWWQDIQGGSAVLLGLFLPCTPTISTPTFYTARACLDSCPKSLRHQSPHHRFTDHKWMDYKQTVQAHDHHLPLQPPQKANWPNYRTLTRVWLWVGKHSHFVPLASPELVPVLECH